MHDRDRSTTIWETEKIPSFSCLNVSKNWEVCVVGGGITGISCAYQLAKRGHQVGLIEGGQIAGAQSSRTTAHLSYLLDRSFMQLLKHYSSDLLQQAVSQHQSAIAVIKKIVSDEGLDCDLVRADSHLIAGSQDGKDFLSREKESADLCKVAVDYLDQVPLLKNKTAGLRFPHTMQFHPLKYLRGLLQILPKIGVDIYEKTRAIDFQNQGDHFQITTSTGAKILAKNVIMASHIPVNDRVIIHTKQQA